MDAPMQKARFYQAPVLGLFGGTDQMISVESIEAFGVELDEAKVENELKVYEGAPHSFFDRAFDQFADDCDDAWRRILGFIERNSG
jgi:carboxymethylenebutenolidase